MKGGADIRDIKIPKEVIMEENFTMKDLPEYGTQIMAEKLLPKDCPGKKIESIYPKILQTLQTLYRELPPDQVTTQALCLYSCPFLKHCQRN